MIRCRTYGDNGPWVVVLHGGPGASGHMAPVARGLSRHCRVLEPFQRRSGGPAPLTVAQHVADLAEVVENLGSSASPILVGSSWGAMLALAYGAAHPNGIAGLALIGCGTFDQSVRAELEEEVRRRIDPTTAAQLAAIANQIKDPDARLRARAETLLPRYCHDPVTLDLEDEVIDARAHEETWADMLRQQEAGVYPASFAAISSPVLMLHGKQDPHPGRRVRDSLLPYLPQLEYVEWDACGHYPWLERAVREEFFLVLGQWVDRVGRGSGRAGVT
jgi:pimeloyl-ACP methyl ester carboxylesterase